ncbi:SusC/RagA family TonB-linked outer membrane protein [Pedobacter sp.]|uniref:SusC/RagA family TonB-linked outer membrane protein n=1 Tax=Pedobacter sp. TaxID=1411316 RepID=UPI003C608BC8
MKEFYLSGSFLFSLEWCKKTARIKKFLPVFIIFPLVFCSFGLYAQNIDIHGIVLDGDNNKEPLAGVSVRVKGKSNSVSTDLTGKFSLKNIEPKAILVFSYVGYTTREFPIGNKNEINITLMPDANSLEEVKVVSIGYGSIKRENLTGSVASISAKDLSKIAVTNVAEALAGRLPGVRVQTMDGAPGADVIVRVRNGGSISQDNSPLYVVDGLIVDNLNDIPPGDIESIDVLKDAATTAIYGSRASNGVILVTTKKPKFGRTSVTLNNYVQVNTFPGERKYQVLSPHEFVMMQYETAAMGGVDKLAQFTKDYGVFDDLELYKQSEPIDKQEELFGKSVVSFYNNISVSGGNSSSRMTLSYNSNRDHGLLPGSGLNRDALNFKLNHEISKKLRLDVGARITNRVVNGAGTSGSSSLRISNLVSARPTNGIAGQLVIDPNSIDDNYLEDFLLSQTNATDLVKQDYRKKTSKSYILNGGITYDIIKNLRANSVFTMNKSFGENLRFYGPLTGVSQVNGGLPVGLKSNTISDSYRLTNTINYNFKKTGKHDVSILLGQEIGSSGGTSQDVQAGGFRPSITPAELFANMQLGAPQYTFQSTAQIASSNIFSLFGRVNYAYDDKYLFAATIRRDASSKFAKANNTGYFPAFSAGWKISSEPFLKDSKTVNLLKLRLSYGTTGNDNIPVNSTNLLFNASDSRGPGFENNLSSVYYQINAPNNTLYNPNLKWETTIGKNLGLDFTLFHSVVNGSLDIYSNKVKDLLVTAQIAPISGFKYQWKNIGSTSNKGIELGLSVNVLNKKDYSLNINANFGINKFKIDELDGTQFLFLQSNWASTDLNHYLDYYLAVGKEVGLIYGYKNDGYYSTDDFSGYVGGKYILKKTDANGKPLVDNSTSLGTNLRPGDLKIQDISGPNGTPDGVIDLYDRTIIGNTLPKATGGFGLSATLKRFDISAFFNWSLGNDEYNAGKIAYNSLWASNGGSYLNMLNTMNSANRFTYIDAKGAVVTDLAALKELNKDKTIWSGNMSFGTRKPVLTDWAVEDASYIRFTNLTVGYTIPSKKWSSGIVSNLRVFVTGTNLALWTRYSGYDPDANSSRADGFQGLTPGLDFSSFPKNRSYTFGLNATF